MLKYITLRVLRHMVTMMKCKMPKSLIQRSELENLLNAPGLIVTVI